MRRLGCELSESAGDLDAEIVHAATRHFRAPLRVPQRAGPQPTSHQDLDRQAAGFAAASWYTRDQVLAAPSPVPAVPGVYGWWFRRLPTAMDVSRCLTRDGCTLLYTGISPKRPPTNGSAPSRQTLRDRLRTHYAGNAEGSTLRKTLGVLLANELGIQLRVVGSGKRMTFVAGEQRLSEWMAAHALVSWVEDPQPWVLENSLIRALDVPLNLQGNSHNRFHPQLSGQRAEAVAEARLLPVVPNPGVGGR